MHSPEYTTINPQNYSRRLGREKKKRERERQTKEKAVPYLCRVLKVNIRQPREIGLGILGADLARCTRGGAKPAELE
jgi:hypothetical protein